MKRTTVFKDMFLHAYAIFILPRVSNRCKPMSGNSIDQSMKLVNWYRLVSANHKTVHRLLSIGSATSNRRRAPYLFDHPPFLGGPRDEIGNRNSDPVFSL